jgi:hypothetical protein
MKCFDHLLTDFVVAARTGNLRYHTEEQRRVFSVLIGEAKRRGIDINFDVEEEEPVNGNGRCHHKFAPVT